MEQLFCCEPSLSEPRSYEDPVLLQDRVLRNMLKTEDRYVPTYSVPNATVQPEVTPEMRRIVAEWMMDVCEEQKCHDGVFLLAMNYMNRFLLRCAIKKSQLQLLGTVCMLLASKLLETRCFAADTLVYYTDHSINKDHLWRWELLVCNKLKWDIAAITPLDFLPHLLKRLLVIEVPGITYSQVLSHAKTLVSLCVRGFEFSVYHPSILACACVASALCGLGWPNKLQRTNDDLLVELQQITNIEKDYIGQCLSRIEEMVQASAERRNNNGCGNGAARPNEMTPPLMKIEDHETAITPTDVHDIRF